MLGLVPGVAVVRPTAGAGAAPLPGEASVRLALVVVAAVVLLAVGAVHWWRWRLGFDRIQLALVVACWALPWKRRNAARRVGLALMAPAAVVLDYIVFYGMVDWP